MTDNTATADGQSAPRSWRGREQGPVKLGGEAHKRLFCRMLLDTFDPYKPAVIDWPTLKPDERDVLVSLPIWDIAVQTEAKAGMRVKVYAGLVADPLVREAIELNGFEESRHKLVLHNMVEAYGIKIAPEPDYRLPRDLEAAFMTTGYSECIDSFFAFGLFALAQRSGYFPKELAAAVRTSPPRGTGRSAWRSRPATSWPCAWPRTTAVSRAMIRVSSVRAWCPFWCAWSCPF